MLVEELFRQQPKSIQERLGRSDDFGSEWGLGTSQAIRLGTSRSIPVRILFELVRRALGEDAEQIFEISEHEKLVVEQAEQAITVQLEKDGEIVAQLTTQDLLLLSEDRESRRTVFDNILGTMGPTEDCPIKRETVEKRPLKDGEAGDLLQALGNSVARVHSDLEAKLQAGQATVADFVPEGLGYYERFCGPAPQELEPEAYLGDVLPGYRQELLRRDLRQGLEICLMGSLRRDICPGAWLGDYANDEVWDALEECEPAHDPISLLGALDVALHRQDDQRFVEFAGKAVERLTQEEFQRPDGKNVYEILPLLAKLSFNRISLQEDAMQRPPFWRRMCAWMQAALVTRKLSGLEFELAHLRRVILDHTPLSGEYAGYVDLGPEPIYSATRMDQSWLREEVMSRLWVMQAGLEDKGEELPGLEALETVTERLRVLSFLFAMMPGPLEGHRRFGAETEPPQAWCSALEGKEQEDVGFVRVMAKLSQIYKLRQGWLDRLVDIISNLSTNNDSTAVEVLEECINAAIVAAVERDHELADEIGQTIQNRSEALAPTEMFSTIIAILVASAAFEDEERRFEWLGEKLAAVAMHVGADEPARQLALHLQALKAVVPRKFRSLGRAEAIAVAGS